MSIILHDVYLLKDALLFSIYFIDQKEPTQRLDSYQVVTFSHFF